jgi:hypothetical protein
VYWDKRNKWGGLNLVWGGGGVRGWPCPGERYTRIPDPGRGYTPPRGGKRICRSGPEKEGGPFIKICIEVVVLSL